MDDGCRLLSNGDDLPTHGLIAHRGNVEEFPESTILAFRSAVAKGAVMIEFDGKWHGVWQTADTVGPFPAELAALTSHWIRLAVPNDNLVTDPAKHL